jgi:hypothetical protein
MANANSGQSCASLTSLSGTTLGWKNNWTWSGGNGVKSFTNIGLNANLNRQLSNINQIPVRLLSRCLYECSIGIIENIFDRLYGLGRRALQDQSCRMWHMIFSLLQVLVVAIRMKS